MGFNLQKVQVMPRKRVIILMALSLVIFGRGIRGADVLEFGPAKRLSVKEPGATALYGRGVPSVAASGENVLLTWVERHDGFDVFCDWRIGRAGQNPDAGPRALWWATNIYDGIKVTGAFVEGFLVSYADYDSSGGLHKKAAILNGDGSIRVAPFTVITNLQNSFDPPAVASNGTNALMICADAVGGLPIFRYVFMGAGGHALSMHSIIPNARSSFGFGMGLASAGGNYLLNWKDSGEHWMFIDGTTGATNAAPAELSEYPVVGFASNGSEYLVVQRPAADRWRVRVVDAPGNVVARFGHGEALLMTNIVIAPNGDNWRIIGESGSIELKRGGDGFAAEFATQPTQGPWAKVVALGGDCEAMASADYVTFWQGIYSTASKRVPGSAPPQNGTLVTPSPAGHLVTWTEITATNYYKYTNLYGVRFLADGTRLDADPILLIWGTPKLDPFVEGDDYVIRRNTVEGRVWTRIATSGLANRRETNYPSYVPNQNTKVLNWKGGQLFATTSSGVCSFTHLVDGVPTWLNVVGSTNAAERITEPKFAAGGGQMMIAARVGSQLQALWVDFNPTAFISNRVVIAGSTAVGEIAAVGDYFLVVWIEYSTRVRMMRLKDGVILENRILWDRLREPVNVAVGANSTDFLVSALAGPSLRGSTNILWTVNAETGETLSATQRVAAAEGRISIASAGEDFLLSECLFDPTTMASRAHVQWISKGERAGFERAGVLGGEFRSGLRLDRRRSYRIERSEDLATWSEVGTVSGVESYEVRESGVAMGTNGFYRAVGVNK